MSEKSTAGRASGAAMNAPTSTATAATTRSSAPHLDGTNRCAIALIVYLALFLDNVLLTVIVPILPEYLASLDQVAQPPALLQLEAGVTQTPQPQQLSYNHRQPESGQQLYMTKHPIPGKSMVNFTLQQLTSEAPPLNAVTLANVGNHSSGSNVSEYNNSNNSSSLERENGSIGLLLAMKALVQLIFNPIVGNLSSKFGYRLPIVVGTFCLLLSSLVFAVGESYYTMLLARAIQGIGSACIGVCGMSLVAQHYPEEARRSKVMGIILGSIALGVLIGYPFGGILYDLVGKSAPFIILSTIIFLNLGLQLLTMDLSVQPEVVVEQQPKWRPLLECKMILAIVVAIWFSTSTMAILEPCLPIWLIQYLRPTKWQLGTVFIPDSLGYFVGTNFFGSIAYRYGQVKISCISLLLVGIASILIPSATTVAQLLLPHFVLGLGIGVIDAALVPLLATFVDATLAQEEHSDNDSGGSMSSYGTVYAIQQTSVSLAYCLAPLIGGELAQTFGFAWLMRTVGLFNMLYGPILVYLYQKYDPKSLREQQNDLLLQSSGRGSRYKQLYNSMDME
ncbi:synaptic vesicular amine transporter [Scaptodrosophila lebanonensis]|uniref:Synaptic vesicular amine transporter n=1 Tax=Drosophila lebanonensis TaxID=7225 RepID=A0A6J2T0N4_DROLE|nr:synaptic vesicular amine transporter [Scaptodrosophila lebanonensis]